MKAFVRSLVRRAVCAVRPRTLVLAYHHVCEPGRTAPWITTSPGRFAEQMEFLARGRLVVPVDRLLADLRERGRVTAGRVVVTFDDAPTDTLEIAYPILRRLGIPATVFVPTGLIGDRRPGWWNRYYRLSRAAKAKAEAVALGPLLGADGPTEVGDPERCAALRWLDEGGREKVLARAAAALRPDDLDEGPTPMTWSQVAALDYGGLVTLGAHTVSHPVLAGLTDDEIATEAALSRDALAKFASFRRVFAYPYGDAAAIDDRVKRLVREAGFEAAFTTEQKSVSGKDDRMALGRVCIDDLSIQEFRWLVDHYLRG